MYFKSRQDFIDILNRNREMNIGISLEIVDKL